MPHKIQAWVHSATQCHLMDLYGTYLCWVVQNQSKKHYGYHTLQLTNTTSKSKIGKIGGSASSTCWYAVLLERAHKQNWPATSKKVYFSWLNCLSSWHKLWYYYFITKFEFVFRGLFFSEEIIIYEYVYGGQFIERYNKLTL